MGITDRYREYAQAFEEAYEDDDWSRLETYFTEDAVYDGGEGPDDVVSGRSELIARLKSGVDAFDRRFDTREMRFIDAPREDSGRVFVKWVFSCTKSGLPALVISGVETAEFEGDRIKLLRDEFDAEARATMEKWMREYGAFLHSE